MKWPNFDRDLWVEIQREADRNRLDTLPAPILGSDRDPEAVSSARINAENCGVKGQVQLIQQELSQVEAPGEGGIVICNPPYGERLGDARELGDLYKLLGDTFKQRFKGWTGYILTGNKELAKRVGLRASRRMPVYNGALPCTLLKYELY